MAGLKRKCSQVELLGGPSDQSRKRLRLWQEEASNKLYWDVTLRGNDGISVHAARIDLAVSSDYFAGLFGGDFADAGRGEVDLPDLAGAVLLQLVQVMYERSITITNIAELNALLVASDRLQFGDIKQAGAAQLAALVSSHNVEDVLRTANALRLPTVKEACCTMLKAILPEHALLVWKLATTYGLPEVQQQVKEHAMDGFSASLDQPGMQQLLTGMDTDSLDDIIGSDRLVASEGQLLTFIRTVLAPQRSPAEVAQLLHLVRYEHMSASELEGCMNDTVLFSNLGVLQQLAKAALVLADPSAAARCLQQRPVRKEAVLNWHISEWSTLSDKIVSPDFSIPGSEQTWSVHLYPRGNRGSCNSHLSMYLRCSRWQLKEQVQFSFVLQHPQECDKTKRKELSKTFDCEKQDWGFTRFISLADLAPKGFVLNDKLHIKVNAKRV